MKKASAFLLLLFVALCILNAVPASSCIVMEDGTLVYVEREYLEGEVEIPEEVDGVRIKKIGNEVFAWSGLTGIVIPEGVTEIGEEAFSCCMNLKSVTLPGSMEKIGDYAFYYCPALISINLPESMTSIGEGAFTLCFELPSIHIGSNISHIGRAAFFGCSSLQSLSIPEKVDPAVGVYSGWPFLTEINLREGTRIIAEYAFANCGLTSVAIPSSVTDIEAYAFIETALTGITLPEGVKRIGEGAFSNCKALKHVTIPESVTRIGEAVFSGSESLEYISYSGTVSNWKKMNPDDSWHASSSVKKVVCLSLIHI